MRSALVLGLALSAFNGVEAATITFEFKASVDQIYDPGRALAGYVVLHDPVTFRLSFDPMLPDHDPDSRYGLYYGPETTFTGTLGNLHVLASGADLKINVGRDSVGANYGLGAHLTYQGVNLRPDEFGLTLFDPTG